VQLARVKCHVFVDFDGTIVPCDATDFLFERFAHPAWREVEAEWQAGQIGSRECMTRQVALLRAAPESLLGALSTIKVDPGFATFVRECERNGVGMTVVSDGFDFVIERVLANAGHRNIGFNANHLEPSGEGRWRVTFPHARSDCRALAGNCKCSFTFPHSSSVKVVIGDGRSDFCIAGEADLVFAKGTLLELCRTNGTAHYAFDDFFSVTKQLSSWLRSNYGSVGGERVRAAAQARG
jgi:2-hydroxy-3-keto-5-methylthiopentenyl-1-phosphate phosphatase